MRSAPIPTTLFRTCTGCGAKVSARTSTTHCPTQERVIADATRTVEAGHLPEHILPMTKLSDALPELLARLNRQERTDA